MASYLPRPGCRKECGLCQGEERGCVLIRSGLNPSLHCTTNEPPGCCRDDRPSTLLHSTGIDVVRNDVAVISELPLAEGAHAVLNGDLSVHQLAHFGVRADLSISARVLRIINTPDTHLSHSPFFWDGFPSATYKRAVNGTQLISAESHSFLQIQLVRIN